MTIDYTLDTRCMSDNNFAAWCYIQHALNSNRFSAVWYFDRAVECGIVLE